MGPDTCTAPTGAWCHRSGGTMMAETVWVVSFCFRRQCLDNFINLCICATDYCQWTNWLKYIFIYRKVYARHIRMHILISHFYWNPWVDILHLMNWEWIGAFGFFEWLCRYFKRFKVLFGNVAARIDKRLGQLFSIWVTYLQVQILNTRICTHIMLTYLCYCVSQKCVNHCFGTPFSCAMLVSNSACCKEFVPVVKVAR